jgi:hypothetical protein
MKREEAEAIYDFEKEAMVETLLKMDVESGSLPDV